MIEFFEERARALVKEAKEKGVRLTIEAAPLQPLAMGNIDYTVDVRDDLATFRAGGRPAPREVWMWWYEGDERCNIADSESEAHSEAIADIESEFKPGDTREYFVGLARSPIQNLSESKWLGSNLLEQIEEWAGDDTGAEDAVLSFSKEDAADLQRLVVEFVRARAKVCYWIADDKAATKHTHTVPHEVERKKADDTEGGTTD